MIALTPTLSPKERERDDGDWTKEIFLRVRWRSARGTARGSHQQASRAPSPGGEGRGEGGLYSEFASNSFHR